MKTGLFFTILVLGLSFLPQAVLAQDNGAAAIKNWNIPQEKSVDKNLPGVKSQADVNKKNLEASYSCNTHSEDIYDDRLDGPYRFGRGLPRLVYTCKDANGVVYTGTEPPQTGAWLPGINPRHIDQN